jgi:site-specific recombinase XerD
MLTLYRRHLEGCKHKDEGRAWTKCQCPIHCDGRVRHRRVRESMETVNWDRARRRMAELEDELASGRVRKPVADATDIFLDARSIEPSTARKYRRIMARLKAFAAERGLTTVDRITLEQLDAYRLTRKLNALSWSKELQLLRTFFGFSMKRKWCEENPATDMDMPSDPKPKPREPYTSEEVTRIIAACQTFGKGAYERLRAHAMILLMRRYALRVSDVSTLERDRVRDDQIFLHALKNGAALWLPLSDDVKRALDMLPLPSGAPADCKYYFWSGVGSKEEHVKTIGRTLQAVFRKSGVKDAHAHRFRHTLATEVLVNGGTIEDAANILGDSPAIVRKHYAKWSREYQSRTIELFRRIHGSNLDTPRTREEFSGASLLKSVVTLVPGVGIEPTLPLPGKGF